MGQAAPDAPVGTHCGSRTRARRIVPLPGDLGCPDWVCRRSWRRIWRAPSTSSITAARFVNWIYPYERLKARERARHDGDPAAGNAQSECKPVHFVSSLGVFPLLGIVRASKSVTRRRYARSQRLAVRRVPAEQVGRRQAGARAAQARGLPVCIYRPGLITGHSETGAWNTSDVTSRMLKSWIELERGARNSPMTRRI